MAHGLLSFIFNVTFLALCRRRPLSKPMPSECDEEENRRGEGSRPNYDSPDKRSLFFFAVIAMNMPMHLNLQAGGPRCVNARTAGNCLRQKSSPLHHRSLQFGPPDRP